MTSQRKGSRRVSSPELLGSFVFFTWWVRWQSAVQAWSRAKKGWLLGGTLVAGTVARLWAQSLPGNWDFGQWLNVSAAVLDGQDPYAIYGYNYPAPWLLTLTAFRALSGSEEIFRLLISLLLLAADVTIVFLLAKRGYLLAACLFFLSPITIAISGQHQQVEGIAVALALAGALVLTGSSGERITKREWLGASLLGLSLAFKPVFLLLPLWFAIQKAPTAVRLVRLVVPGLVFGIALAVAFLAYPASTVVSKVLGHGGANNSPFVNAVVPQQIAPWFLENQGGKLVFLVLLIAAGVLFRRLPFFELTLFYSITALVFSWAVANQYLATPMAAVAVYLNVGFFVWLLMSSLYLGGDSATLNIPGLNQIQPHVLLEWNQVMQDLFPWLLLGWILLLAGRWDRIRGRVGAPE